jgi:hypothetical protein
MMVLYSALGLLLGLLLIAGVLLEAFEAVVLPRRVTRPYRFTRLYFWSFWKLWRAVALAAFKRTRPREAFLSWFGPLSLLGLFALWFLGLIVGFGLFMWSVGMPVQVTAEGKPDLPTYCYLSGVTFFTLGFGDVTPKEPLGRTLVVVEAGLGFGFLALMVSYLPVLYQAFSRREVTISMLDARAGSPPSAAQALIRAAGGSTCDALEQFLREWERWSAEVLESHLSYPVLSYYRSQHDNQSWLAALTTVLDTCALLLTGLKEHKPFQSQLTFAMARHAVVDLSLVFQVPPLAPAPDRLPADKLQILRDKLRKAGLELRADPAVDAKLAELRGLYEPFVNALAQHFLLALPPIDPEHTTVDNWQTSAWTRRTPGIGKLPIRDPSDEHFD